MVLESPSQMAYYSGHEKDAVHQTHKGGIKGSAATMQCSGGHACMNGPQCPDDAMHTHTSTCLVPLNGWEIKPSGLQTHKNIIPR
jgi:hypothetical protein